VKRVKKSATAKRPRGRPRNDVPRVPANITLPEAIRDKARRIGDGEISRGIELAIERFVERQ